MATPLHKRDFDLFLSYAHADRAFVEELYKWLTDKVGFAVWWDAQEMSAGARIGTDLQRAVMRCRGILLVATDESLTKGWVQEEYNIALNERANDSSFRVVALRIGNADQTELMSSTSWIDLAERKLDGQTAVSIINAFYPGEHRPNPLVARDVYVSCSWHTTDRSSALAVSRVLAGQGVRLVGDAKDKKGFGEGDSVEAILRSCGGLLAVVPFRGVEQASLQEKTYKYFLREIDLAAALDLPRLVIADPRVHRVDGPDTDWVRLSTDAKVCPADVTSRLEKLADEWRPPSAPHYLFWALDVESDAARPSAPIRHMIERITGLRIMVGTDLRGDPVQAAIMKGIADAFLVLADITDDNINTCIEAGMALASRTNLELIARGQSRSPPFMLRSKSLANYEDDVARAGLLHNIVRPYARRIINAEL
jgi:TIR domain